MNEKPDLWQAVNELREGQTIVLSTTQGYLTDKSFVVREVNPNESHARADGQHYRVYCEGTGEPPGQYVIHRDPVEWSRRRVQRTEPELFYIDEPQSPSGADERSEGEITTLR